jgi:hypothetical protein
VLLLGLLAPSRPGDSGRETVSNRNLAADGRSSKASGEASAPGAPCSLKPRIRGGALRPIPGCSNRGTEWNPGVGNGNFGLKRSREDGKQIPSRNEMAHNKAVLVLGRDVPPSAVSCGHHGGSRFQSSTVKFDHYDDGSGSWVRGALQACAHTLHVLHT